MDQENFSPQESLKLIQSMITKTQQDMGDNSKHFLLWGWITFIACTAQFILIKSGFEKHYLVWLLIIPGIIISTYFGIKDRKRQIVKSYLGNIDTVYVKYNAKEFPGTDPIVYDVFFVGDIGHEYINCNKLKCGNYYLYAVAIDSVTSHRVSGGVPIQIKYSERKKSINIIIPLSE